MKTKTEFILEQLNKTGGKKYERYVIHKIFNDLFNDSGSLSLKFTCQQYVKRSEDTYALLDMYIPSIQVQIEVDEYHHNSDQNKSSDAIRQTEIANKIHQMNTLEKTQIIDTSKLSELIRIKVTNDTNKVRTLDEINKDIESIVEAIKKIIEKLKPVPWDYESEYSWKKYANKKAIKVQDNVELRYISDVHNIFGGTKSGMEFTEGAQTVAFWPHTRSQNSPYIWCPKKGHGKWDNELTDCGNYILEKVNSVTHTENKPHRVTFYHSRDNLGQTFYRFCGVFRFKEIVYKMINAENVEYSKYEKIEDEISIYPVQFSHYSI